MFSFDIGQRHWSNADINALARKLSPGRLTATNADTGRLYEYVATRVLAEGYMTPLLMLEDSNEVIKVMRRHDD